MAFGEAEEAIPFCCVDRSDTKALFECFRISCSDNTVAVLTCYINIATQIHLKATYMCLNSNFCTVDWFYCYLYSISKTPEQQAHAPE